MIPTSDCTLYVGVVRPVGWLFTFSPFYFVSVFCFLWFLTRAHLPMGPTRFPVVLAYWPIIFPPFSETRRRSSKKGIDMLNIWTSGGRSDRNSKMHALADAISIRYIPLPYSSTQANHACLACSIHRVSAQYNPLTCHMLCQQLYHMRSKCVCGPTSGREAATRGCQKQILLSRHLTPSPVAVETEQTPLCDERAFANDRNATTRYKVENFVVLCL